MAEFTRQTFPILAHVITHFPVPDASRIDDTQRSIGCKFPEDYRTFLIEHNGCIFDRNLPSIVGRIRRPVPFLEWFNVEILLAICVGGIEEEYTIEWTLDCFSDVLPQHLVPMMTCGYGYGLISCRDSDFGTCYFWERDTSRDASVEDIHVVADSFKSFLHSLTRRRIT